MKNECGYKFAIEPEGPSLFEEFDQSFADRITVDRPSDFEILLGHASMGCLGDEVSVVKCYFLKYCSSSVLSSVLH